MNLAYETWTLELSREDCFSVGCPTWCAAISWRCLDVSSLCVLCIRIPGCQLMLFCQMSPVSPYIRQNDGPVWCLQEPFNFRYKTWLDLGNGCCFSKICSFTIVVVIAVLSLYICFPLSNIKIRKSQPSQRMDGYILCSRNIRFAVIFNIKKRGSECSVYTFIILLPRGLVVILSVLNNLQCGSYYTYKYIYKWKNTVSCFSIN